MAPVDKLEAKTVETGGAGGEVGEDEECRWDFGVGFVVGDGFGLGFGLGLGLRVWLFFAGL